MRVLGLDIGEARVGVAVSDRDGVIASPLTVLSGRDAKDPMAVARLVEQEEAQAVVIGLPVSLDGTEGPQAERVRKQAERIGAVLEVPMSFQDERLSTTAAHRALAEAGVRARDRRGSVDMLAAAVLLQSWLDSRRHGGERR